MTELKPCKKCGGEPKSSSHKPMYRTKFFVYCLNCNYSTHRYHDKEQEAMDTWNQTMSK